VPDPDAELSRAARHRVRGRSSQIDQPPARAAPDRPWIHAAGYGENSHGPAGFSSSPSSPGQTTSPAEGGHHLVQVDILAAAANLLLLRARAGRLVSTAGRCPGPCGIPSRSARDSGIRRAITRARTRKKPAGSVLRPRIAVQQVVESRGAMPPASRLTTSFRFRAARCDSSR